MEAAAVWLYVHSEAVASLVDEQVAFNDRQMTLNINNQDAIEFVTATLETAIDFADLSRLATEAQGNEEAARYTEKAYSAFTAALDSIESSTFTDTEWERITTLLARFNSLVETKNGMGSRP